MFTDIPYTPEYCDHPDTEPVESDRKPSAEEWARCKHCAAFLVTVKPHKHRWLQTDYQDKNQESGIPETMWGCSECGLLTRAENGTDPNSL